MDLWCDLVQKRKEAIKNTALKAISDFHAEMQTQSAEN